MLTGRDGTKIIGPFDAATVIDMLDSGDIDKDSSLISYSPDGLLASGRRSPRIRSWRSTSPLAVRPALRH